ncbi:MAG: divalent metal cation transporter [Candidatus Pacebacteria bacterium]|nr:divalent metal cation transporter [Candidatus Paceibacterota bacterium]
MMKFKEYWKILGPGLTTGAADDDPSGITTYSQVGAQRGFGLAWMALFSLPLLGVVQEMSARIGLVTGVGLAENIKRHYSKKVLYTCTLLLLVANIFNIGANLGAMAEGAKLLFPQLYFPFLVAGFAFLSLVLQVFVTYKNYSKYLKYLALVLFAYVFSALSIDMNWGEIFKHTIIPMINFSKEELLLVCAVLGTTISPYLFFWQSSQEVEEDILRGEDTEEKRRTMTTAQDISNMRVDVWSGMIISNIVMFFIIIACAATIFNGGGVTINSAAEAASALRPFAGNAAFILFALGILGTGMLSIPVLAGSASYAVSESFGWKEGLNMKLKQATSFYGVIALAMVLGIVLNFVGFDPIKMLIYSAVLNGIISPIILFLIVRISGKEDVMGKHTNSVMSKILGWLAVGIMSVVSILAIVFLVI